MVFFCFFLITRYSSVLFFFFSSRRRHTRCYRDWSSDVCSSDLHQRSSFPDRLGTRFMTRPLLLRVLPGSPRTRGTVRPGRPWGRPRCVLWALLGFSSPLVLLRSFRRGSSRMVHGV